jgi:hypothetical protein
VGIDIKIWGGVRERASEINQNQTEPDIFR